MLKSQQNAGEQVNLIFRMKSITDAFLKINHYSMKSALIALAFSALLDAGNPSHTAFDRRLSANAATAVSAVTDADWTAMNSGGIYGANGPVYAEVYYKKHLYVGGNFSVIGTTFAKNIAVWDGSNWSALGLGTDTTILALAVDSSGALYAAGLFYHAGDAYALGIARWNGATWSGLGTGNAMDLKAMVGPPVKSIVIDRNGIVYATGQTLDNTRMFDSDIARWDGASWSAPGDHVRFHWGIYALACDKKGNLYAGGEFDSVGGMHVNCIARWNGSRWDSLQAGLQSSPAGPRVFALLCDNNDDLFAGGFFWDAGDSSAVNVARWDGSRWHPVGKGLQTYANGGGVYALAKSPSGRLCAAGIFNYVNGDTTTSNIAQWDGQIWQPLGIGFYGPDFIYNDGGISYIKQLHALAFGDKEILYAGGKFSRAGGKKINSMAQWDGSAWNPIGPSIPGPVKSAVNAVLSDHRGHLYVGGAFDGGIAKWDGARWDTLGVGIQGTVLSLCLDSSGNIYAGGQFDSAGGHKAKNIAQWNGTKWMALDLGLSPGPVRALACDAKGMVFAGGQISSAGRIATHAIARWNGFEWDSLGRGFPNDNGKLGMVYALAIDSSQNVFAGGDFQVLVNNHYVSYLGKWNGAEWDSVKGWEGRFNEGIVQFMTFDARSDCFLSVVRRYNTITGAIIQCDVMECSHDSLRRLATMDGYVEALTLDRNGNLYAAGNFDSISFAQSNMRARGIAKWNHSKWEALGSGIQYDGKTLSIEDSALFVGGGFFTAGPNWSPYIAKVNIHNFMPAVLPGHFFFTEQLRFYCHEGELILIGCGPRDAISLYSLSGKLLKRAMGVSRVPLRDLTRQVIIARIMRDNAVLKSEKLLLE